MATIKKIQIRTDDGNDYGTILHPETSTDMVIDQATGKSIASLTGTPGGLASYENLANAVAYSKEPKPDNTIFQKGRDKYKSSKVVSNKAYRTDVDIVVKNSKGLKKLRIDVKSVVTYTSDGFGFGSVGGYRLYIDGSIKASSTSEVSDFVLEVDVSDLTATTFSLRLDFKNDNPDGVAAMPTAAVTITGNEIFLIQI